MERRSYRLGRRQPSVERTHAAILAAARDLLAGHPVGEVSVGQVARQAGVSRITVYNRFGSKAGLIEALADSSSPPTADARQLEPREALRRRLAEASDRWSADPGLHRNLAVAPTPGEAERDRHLAERLAA